MKIIRRLIFIINTNTQEDDHDNLIKFSDMPKEFGGSGEIIEYKYIY